MSGLIGLVGQISQLFEPLRAGRAWAARLTGVGGVTMGHRRDLEFWMDEVVPVQASPLRVDFADFFQREHLRLGRAIYLLCGDRFEAEDLIQEALARACERWDQVSVMQEPAGYVYRIAANLHRRRMRRQRIFRPLSGFEEPSGGDEAYRVERHADVWAALSRLRFEQREAVVLVELLGYEPAAAAKMLGIAPGAMRVRLHRGREALRRTLGGDDV
jgi:RNA polymerase sigma-70 factor (ECF subfamily)